MKRQTKTASRLVENILSLYILQGLNYLIPMAVLPYLVRTLGIEMYGLLSFAQSFAQYFTLLTDYGFNFTATRSLAKHGADRERVSRIFSSVLIVKLALMVLGAVLLVLIASGIQRFRQDFSFFVVAYVAVIGNVLFPTWFFQGMEQMRYISIIIGVSRLFGAAALFLFVHHPEDAFLALAIQSATPLVGGITGLWIAFRHFRLRVVVPDLTEIRSAIVEGWHLFVTTAAVSLYTNTNVFLVGLLGGNIEAGYFSAAEKIIRAMQGLLTPITQALFPHMSSLVTQSKEAAMQFAYRALKWIGALSLVVSCSILTWARPIASMCFGTNAAGCIPIIRFIAFLPFVIAISNVFAVQMMIPFGLDKQLSNIVIIAGILNVLMAIWLIRLLGAKGAGISVLITETFVAVATGFAFRSFQNRAICLGIKGA